MDRFQLLLDKNYNIRLKLVVAFIFLIITVVKGQTNQKSDIKASPVFSKVTYQGNDEVYNKFPLRSNEFYSPILQGCYPDPAITKKGDDYYMVCSSFAMFPGVPIFHSKDLVNWTDLGGVLNNVSDFNPKNTGISEGVYAPGITYNPYNDTFYVIVTVFSEGLGNIVVKTKDPQKGWGRPIKLDFGGIDPSIFFDDNGKAYVVHNDAPDKGKELYNGHRVIKIWDYDLENDRVIPGTDKIIVNGGTDISKKPIWIEAPHLYKRNNKYYLMCAEGGTGGNHSEVIFISDHPRGPFLPAPNNPILTQRHLPIERENKVDWAGHADIVEGPNGQNYGVFLAVRPNEKHRVNTGRETFILPVDWSGIFPVFENGLQPLEPKLAMPVGVENQVGKNDFFPSGNFTFTDDFTAKQLDYRWIGLRGPREEFVNKTTNGLKITPFDTNIKEVKPTSTLFYRQQHNTFSFSTTLNYKPKSEHDLAGVVALQNEGSNYVFGVTRYNNKYFFVLQKNSWPNRQGKIISTIVASKEIELNKPIKLQIKAEGDNYEFNYAINGAGYTNLGGIVSGDILSTDVAGGFTGCLLGLYATSANDALPVKE
ncbi:glycoside hydrolase family 43 protein [Formosa sp. A9]|uniref:glycoside hydrolase family 43 protein n=1 Tax=Formosa sp. A9 TaxID=3442641 RepID=UPI003EBFF9C0